MLSISNLSKTYGNGVQALRSVNLEIGTGMFGLLGPNGAGKSTLMRTIAGLQEPDEGHIALDGVDIVAHPQVVREQLGYLPQEFGVYPRISALNLLDHIAVLKGLIHKAERREQVEALLAQTNLYQDRHKAVSTFSGGMRQRFGIAMALLGNPRLLIVDEPTAGLDPEERNRFHNLLCEMGQNRVVLLSTHIVEDVRELCSHMAILFEGQVVLQGRPNALIERLEGCIWQKSVHRDEVGDLKKQFRVLSVRLSGGKPLVNVLAETPPDPDFYPVPPDLEDVYFAQVTRGVLC